MAHTPSLAFLFRVCIHRLFLARKRQYLALIHRISDGAVNLGECGSTVARRVS